MHPLCVRRKLSKIRLRSRCQGPALLQPLRYSPQDFLGSPSSYQSVASSVLSGENVHQKLSRRRRGTVSWINGLVLHPAKKVPDWGPSRSIGRAPPPRPQTCLPAASAPASVPSTWRPTCKPRPRAGPGGLTASPVLSHRDQRAVLRCVQERGPEHRLHFQRLTAAPTAR